MVELTTDYFSSAADQHAPGGLPAILHLSPLHTELGDAPSGTSPGALAPGAVSNRQQTDIQAGDVSGACAAPSPSTAGGTGGSVGAPGSQLAVGRRTGSSPSMQGGHVPAGGPVGQSDLHVSAASGMTIALSPALAHLASHGASAGSPKVGGGGGGGGAVVHARAHAQGGPSGGGAAGAAAVAADGGDSSLVHAHAPDHGSGAGPRGARIPSGGGAESAAAAAGESSRGAGDGAAPSERDAWAVEGQQPPNLHPAVTEAIPRAPLQSNVLDRGRSRSEGPAGATRRIARLKSHSPDSAHGGYLSPVHPARADDPHAPRRASTYDGHVSHADVAAAPAYRRVTWDAHAAQGCAEDPAQAQVQTQGSGGPPPETPARPAPALVSPWHTTAATAATAGYDNASASTAANASGGGGGGGGSDPFVYGSSSTTARPPSHVQGHVHAPSPLGTGAAPAMHHHLSSHHQHHGAAHAAHAGSHHGGGGGGGNGVTPLLQRLLQARGSEAEEGPPAGALESFQSGDGFGAPYLDDGRSAPDGMARYRPLLEQLHAKPGDYLTQIIMEVGA